MCCQVRMLIIDSVSSLIAPVLGGGGAHGICSVNTIDTSLSSIDTVQISYESKLCFTLPVLLDKPFTD